MFRKKKEQPPEVTNDAFGRWIRAFRPPFQWFMELSEDEQTQLAILGDEYAQDLTVAVGYAVKDPEMADAGISMAKGGEESLQGEEVMARRIAMGVIDNILGAAQRPTEPPPVPQGRSQSLSGVGKENATEETTGGEERPAGSFLGRQPDAEAEQ